jgi:lipopolysaccharide transport system ATP-binding protein
MNSTGNLPAAISLQNLSKVYKLYDRHLDRLIETLHPFKRGYHRDFHALRGITVEIRKGESVGIVGRNGSGKSTLLRLIAGVSQPSAGVLNVQGRVSALLELGTGFNPELTGKENVFFYGMLIGLSRAQMEEKLEDIFAFADIGDFVYQPVKLYSSGMLVRLAFAVATHIDPEILIVDEALAVGDLLFQKKCFQRIEKFRGQGKTILFVSHSTAMINELSTRCILLDKGELILDGPSRLVTKQYERFIFSKAEFAAGLREEILLLNQDFELKQKLAELIHDSSSGTKKESKTALPGQDPLYAPQALFLPELKAQSLVECRNADVDIYDIQIETPEGERVNALVMDEHYIYSYKVCFHLPVEQVVFGMKIKNRTGVEVLGISAPGYPGQGHYLHNVMAGENYLVQWDLHGALVPGIYSVNAGVYGNAMGEDGFLNRIVDCLVFKVQEPSFCNFSGIAHLVSNIKIEKL